jgi:hypothetical protein
LCPFGDNRDRRVGRDPRPELFSDKNFDYGWIIEPFAFNIPKRVVGIVIVI